MAKFRAKIWKTGNSWVITVPTQMIGAEVEKEQEYIWSVDGWFVTQSRNLMLIVEWWRPVIAIESC